MGPGVALNINFAQCTSSALQRRMLETQYVAEGLRTPIDATFNAFILHAIGKAAIAHGPAHSIMQIIMDIGRREVTWAMIGMQKYRFHAVPCFTSDSVLWDQGNQQAQGHSTAGSDR